MKHNGTSIRRLLGTFVSILVLSFVAAVICASADPGEEMEKSIQQMDQESQQIQRMCETPEGEAQLRANLRERFAINDEEITRLRDQGLGFGEIGTLYSLSQASGKDPAELLRLRTEEKLGWGKIAAQANAPMGVAVQTMKELGLSKGKTIGSEEQIRERVRTKVREQEQTESPEKMETPERHEHQKGPEHE